MTIYLVYEDLGHYDVVAAAFKTKESADAFIKSMESARYYVHEIKLEE